MRNSKNASRANYGLFLNTRGNFADQLRRHVPTTGVAPGPLYKSRPAGLRRVPK